MEKKTHEFLKSRFFFQSLIEICEFYRFPFFVPLNSESNDLLALSQYFCSSKNIYETIQTSDITPDSYNYVIDFLTSSDTDYKRKFIDFYDLFLVEEKLFLNRIKTQSSFFSNCQKNISQYSFEDVVKRTQSVEERSNKILQILQEKF